MVQVLRFPGRRAELVAAATLNLSGRSMTECLDFWAQDLRNRGLVAEASYFDAALLTIRGYEQERNGGSRLARAGERGPAGG